jgi:hypothetical protein
MVLLLYVKHFAHPKLAQCHVHWTAANMPDQRAFGNLISLSICLPCPPAANDRGWVREIVQANQNS